MTLTRRGYVPIGPVADGSVQIPRQSPWLHTRLVVATVSVLIAVMYVTLVLRTWTVGTAERTVTEQAKFRSPFRLVAHPSVLEDGENVTIAWEGIPTTPLHQLDYLTLSCGPTNHDDDYLQRINTTESVRSSVVFSGSSANLLPRCVWCN